MSSQAQMDKGVTDIESWDDDDAHYNIQLAQDNTSLVEDNTMVSTAFTGLGPMDARLATKLDILDDSDEGEEQEQEAADEERRKESSMTSTDTPPSPPAHQPEDER
ncbi:hypothetical protein PHYBOEH_000964 [Phytophthora boehmeriae]|uniref:Uncharacterized protein n=1 Tax=Phytophthora boehmeriae TaxID=109152 RepID=A0A8T1X0I9_9STRA|nr:hypothetical protein PHYBOEH_000964 [Phytophthora boehmeriae]